ncbi:MAG: hypothetical protein ABJH98_10080 [Reichenbachiella sp.]|uniref:hypothetical protein n=1 Tax=Reichenbachiella sp. TaxID=2184521 RepID=UPI0032993C8F
MKSIKTNILLIFGLTTLLLGCASDENPTLHGDFEFTIEYLSTVTVGGVVGITERHFEVGEIYEGTDDGEATIVIRIAEHTELNEDCPNSWCYQELLSVPRGHLKFVE